MRSKPAWFCPGLNLNVRNDEQALHCDIIRQRLMMKKSLEFVGNYFCSSCPCLTNFYAMFLDVPSVSILDRFLPNHVNDWSCRQAPDQDTAIIYSIFSWKTKNITHMSEQVAHFCCKIILQHFRVCCSGKIINTRVAPAAHTMPSLGILLQQGIIKCFIVYISGFIFPSDLIPAHQLYWNDNVFTVTKMTSRPWEIISRVQK